MALLFETWLNSARRCERRMVEGLKAALTCRTSSWLGRRTQKNEKKPIWHITGAVTYAEPGALPVANHKQVCGFVEQRGGFAA